MRNFKNDYNVLATDEIVEAIVKYHNEVNDTYGLDYHGINAANLIKKTFKLNDDADIYFALGGTMANLLVISYLLRPYEAVIAANTGHINIHETGAVEATGHKIVTCQNKDGKLRIEDVKNILATHNEEHKVKLRMFYISMSTETGTLYSKKELEELSKLCKENDLYLFIDGARLASALTSKYNDVPVNMIGKVADIFYIGGTKNGLLSGEAIVFKNKNLSKDFRYYLKQRGAMLAKGYLLGIQFERLFQDNLFFDLGTKANNVAMYLSGELEKINVPLQYVTYTNQIFFRVNEELKDYLIKEYDLELWEVLDDDNYVVRAVCSFATDNKMCDILVADVRRFLNG